MNLRGKKIVVTGTFSRPRSEIEALLAEHGATVVDTVSSTTDLLVVGLEAGSKLALARELGVAVLNEAELRHLLDAAPAPVTGGFTFPLFDRLEAWVRLLASRPDVRMSKPLRISEPQKLEMEDRAYPDDARELASRASAFEFAYELPSTAEVAAVPPPPAPPPRAPGVAIVAERELPVGRQIVRMGERLVVKDGPTLSATELDGTPAWSTTMPNWAVGGLTATPDHLVVGLDDYLDASKRAVVWLDPRTGEVRGRSACETRMSFVAVIGSTVFCLPDTAPPDRTDILALDAPGAEPRVLTQPAGIYPVVGSGGCLLLNVHRTASVRAISPAGELSWERPGSLVGWSDTEALIAEGTMLCRVDVASSEVLWRADVLTGKDGARVTCGHDVVVIMEQSTCSLVCLDRASGARRWSASLGQSRIVVSAPIITQRYVLAEDTRRNLAVFSRATGELLDAGTAPGVDGLREMVVIDEDAEVRLFVAGRPGWAFRVAFMEQPPLRLPDAPPPPPPAPPKRGFLYLSLIGEHDDRYVTIDDEEVPEEDLFLLEGDGEGTGLAAFYVIRENGDAQVIWGGGRSFLSIPFPSITAYLTEGAKRAFSYPPAWQHGREPAAIEALSLPTSTPHDAIVAALIERGASPPMAADLVRWLGGAAALLVPRR